MDDDDIFLEQFCVGCQNETDQRTTPGTELASCLRCGHVNPVQAEQDRVAALLRRVKDDHSAELGRLRAGWVPFV